MPNRMSYAIAVVVLLCAAGLRMWNLPTLPAGLSDAELAQVDLMDDQIKRGDIRVFYETASGRGQEGLYPMLLALSSLLFGNGIIGFRILSVFAGLITLALMYSLGVRLFGRLTGLAAIIVMAVTMWDVVLSRLVLTESLLPLLVTGTLLALGRAMPVYPRIRTESTNTLDFAALGILLGLGFYLHPYSLMLVLAAMVFIVYILLIRRPLSLRRLSYIGFAILMMFIIAVPYLISTIQQPELSANGRIIGYYGNLLSAVQHTIVGIMIQGDMNPLYNLPGRPLIDPVSGVFMLIGIIACVRYWREPRYALLLIAGAFLGIPAMFAQHPPHFLSMSVVLPVIILLTGLGIALLLQNLPESTLIIGIVGVLALLGFNIVWTMNDIFLIWPQRADVQQVYNSHLGAIAHRLDTTADDIPTVFCYPEWNRDRQPDMRRTPAENILLLMNRDQAPLRFVDCSHGFLFAQGGDLQQVVIPEPALRSRIPANIMGWLNLGRSVEGIPQDSVLLLDVTEELADALGIFTTTAPATYELDATLNERDPVPPPIRFGGNITWLGYEINGNTTYRAGNAVPVTTYWRVEGSVPSDLTIFTHILSDPVTLLSNRDTIAVNPRQLRERDVFMQYVRVPLPHTALPGDYAISVGVYQSSSDDRLTVIAEDGTAQGERLFLDRITIERHTEDSN